MIEGLTMKSYWNLIEEKKFQEAFDNLKQQYEESQKTGYTLGNLVISSLLLKDYESALKYSIINEENDPIKGETNFVKAGAALWNLGRINEAVEMWKRGLEPVPKLYTSNIVTIPALLFHASVYLKDNKLQKAAVRSLKKRWKSKIELAGFLLDEITEEQLTESISPHSIMSIRERCRVEFYLGTKCLQKGNEKGYIEHLQKCKEIEGEYLEIEYYLAVGELDRLSIPK
jgi:tetratricopeptide (TPR) repeat protein